MKKYNYKRRNNYKKFYRRKKKKSDLKSKKWFIILLYIFKILKIVFIIFLIKFHSYCDNYKQSIINYYYKLRIGNRRSNFNKNNLITFGDKISWLLIYDTTKLKGKCADKILLHQISKRILKKDICNKILKIYDNPDQINIDELPEKFVLKTNHGSGYNIIVGNRTEFDIEKAKETLSKWLKIDYGYNNREFQYSFIKRKVFAEEYIGENLINYKFFCYHGVPKYLYIRLYVDHHRYWTFFDMNWNKLDIICNYPLIPFDVPKPKKFELMKKYARKLSHPFIFVRVDLYEVYDEVRLGELTFSPMNGGMNCRKISNARFDLGDDIKIV